MAHPSAALVGVAVLLAIGAGCVSLGRQNEEAKLPTDKLATVKLGRTTRSEILTRFGVNRPALIFGFFNYVKSVDKTDRLMFLFDRAGRVAGYGLTEGTKEL